MRLFKTSMFVAVTVAILSGVLNAAAMGQEHTKDSLDTVKKNLADKKAVLLDVREKVEWDEGHLQQATLMPMSKLKASSDLKSLTKDLDPKKIVYCHCMAGRRALSAATVLQKLGYDVRPLKQGYDELVEAGFPKAAEPKKK